MQLREAVSKRLYCRIAKESAEFFVRRGIANLIVAQPVTVYKVLAICVGANVCIFHFRCNNGGVGPHVELVIIQVAV